MPSSSPSKGGTYNMCKKLADLSLLGVIIHLCRRVIKFQNGRLSSDRLQRTIVHNFTQKWSNILTRILLRMMEISFQD